MQPGAPLYDGDIDPLASRCAESNRGLLASLREDANADELDRLAWADAKLGRMSDPVVVNAISDHLARFQFRSHWPACSSYVFWLVRLVPRFSVVQGLRPDGSDKVRPIDNFSWSHQSDGARKRSRNEAKAQSVNGHFDLRSGVHHDHLDDLLAS